MTATSEATIEPFATAFELDLPHGTVVAVALPEPEEPSLGNGLCVLHPAEREVAEGLAPLRRVSWIGGRIALRRALERVGLISGPILSTPRGAPRMPDNVMGSISHKSRLAAAIVAPTAHGTVGFDLEQLAPERPKIERLVLTPSEREAISVLPPEARWQGIITRFSVKECVFKALDPYVQRYIGFQEAAIALHADGTAAIELALKNGEGPFAVEGRWVIRGEWLLATVRAHLASTTMLSTFQ